MGRIQIVNGDLLKAEEIYKIKGEKTYGFNHAECQVTTTKFQQSLYF